MLLEDGSKMSKTRGRQAKHKLFPWPVGSTENIIPLYERHFNTPLDWRSFSVSYPKVLAAESPINVHFDQRHSVSMINYIHEVLGMQ